MLYLMNIRYSNTPEALLISKELEWTDEQYDTAQAHLEQFYEEVFCEMAKFGEIEDMVVVDNISDHMLGNLYVKYYREEVRRSLLMLLNYSSTHSHFYNCGFSIR